MMENASNLGQQIKTSKDSLYEKIAQFLDAHPEAVDMSTEESDKLFEQWLRAGN